MMNGSAVLNSLQNLKPVNLSRISIQSGLSVEEVKNIANWLIEIGVPLIWSSENSVKLLRQVIPLDLDYIRNSVAIIDSDIAQRVVVVDHVDSTNEILLNLATQQSIHKHACIAEYMSAGRGRRRRKWSGSAYENVMLSIAWDFSKDIRILSGLSLAVAVIVVQCLSELTNEALQVKWPNDILWEYRKLSGILLETRDTTAVIGIGINCSLSDDDRNAIDQPVACLSDLPDYSANRNVLVSRLLCSLGHGLEIFMKQRLEPFRQEWMQKHAYSNKRILTDGMNPREGTAIGIDGNGALLLKLDSGEIIPVQAGEISILGE